MADDAFTLNIIQNLAHLLGRVLVMIQKGNEISDGSLEVNVVFPKRVIGINEQRLPVRTGTLSHNATS
jgi:hypothetical protein